MHDYWVDSHSKRSNGSRLFTIYGGTKTFASKDALDSLPVYLDDAGVKHPLLLTDIAIAESGILDLLVSILGTSHAPVAVVSDIPYDSDVITVKDTAALYHAVRADGIIALGGGSVIDTAKGVNILTSLGGENLSAWVGAGMIDKPLKPLFAIPTTAGTGSEATLVAVIKDHATHKKLLFTSPFLAPSHAILDPRCTATLPLTATASTAMDALTHALEAHIGLASNPVSSGAAFQAIRLIRTALPKVMVNPSDLEARLSLSIAAHIAGRAFSNSMVGLVHTIGHSVGAVCGIPHGICMSILLPYCMEAKLDKAPVNMRIGEALLPLTDLETYTSVPREDSCSHVVRILRHMNGELAEMTGGHHPLRLMDPATPAGVRLMHPEDLPRIIDTALGDGSQFYDPIGISPELLQTILEAAYWGYPFGRVAEMVRERHL